MKKIIFTLSCFICLSAFAQVQIKEVYLQSGAFFGQTNSSLADLQTLAPNSSILSQDLSAYQSYPQYLLYIPGQSQSLSIGLELKQLPKATLRVGIMHTKQNNALASGGSYTESFRVDTLTSSQTGEQFFIDSFSTHSYNAQFAQEQLRLDASLIFRYKAEKRWSFYGGIGVNFGLSYNSTTTVHQRVSPYGNGLEYGMFNDLFYDGGTHETESFENKGGFGMSIYTPLGIDFQVGKKREFWKPIHLYAELRPGVNINQIAGLGTSFSAGNFSNLGLRFQFK